MTRAHSDPHTWQGYSSSINAKRWQLNGLSRLLNLRCLWSLHCCWGIASLEHLHPGISQSTTIHLEEAFTMITTEYCSRWTAACGDSQQGSTIMVAAPDNITTVPEMRYCGSLKGRAGCHAWHYLIVFSSSLHATSHESLLYTRQS